MWLGICKEDNLQSRAPVTYLYPWRNTSIVGIRTVTSALSYSTERPLSQRGPMPISLWLKVGMMCPWRKFNDRRGMMQDDTDVCACRLAVPTMMGGTFILQPS